MNILPSTIAGLRHYQLIAHGDSRGSFKELFREERAEKFGHPTHFPQENLSRSIYGVLRGLHGQSPRPQGKLVTCLFGSIWDVVADIRPGSPTYGQWEGFDLSDSNHGQVYVPPGCLHGFLVTSPEAIVIYKVTDTYAPEGDFAVRFDDPEIGVEWPVPPGMIPILSAKDQAAPLLKDLPANRVISYQESIELSRSHGIEVSEWPHPVG